MFSMMKKRQQKKKAGWDHVANWYHSITGSEGHYYQREIILPNVLNIIKTTKARKLLDIACGQGVLERALPKEIDYCGVDISPSLIQQAKSQSVNNTHRFHTFDVSSKEFDLQEKDFDAATIILALQDIKDIRTLFRNTHKHLIEGGVLHIVMNHPCFRIPRHTSWDINDQQKVQNRVVRSYMSAMEIPIAINPGQGKDSESVTYFHQPISAYSKTLKEAGFVIQEMDEWVSNKKSSGPKSKMENRARDEFPLFLYLSCKKVAERQD